MKNLYLYIGCRAAAAQNQLERQSLYGYNVRTPSPTETSQKLRNNYGVT